MWSNSNLKYSCNNVKIYVYKNQNKWFGRACIKFNDAWISVCEVIEDTEKSCLDCLLSKTRHHDNSLFEEVSYQRNCLLKALVAVTRCSEKALIKAIYRNR